MVDAVDYFQQLSRDYNEANAAPEQWGISFVLKLRDGDSAKAETDKNEAPFSVTGADDTSVFLNVEARSVSLYDALKLVCDAAGYKFSIRGGYVTITPQEEEVKP